MNWVKLFYRDVESAVVINGWTSSFFHASRGVRQGCPLSPLLYVFSIGVLAECIRKSPRITGVTIPHLMDLYKCSGYADDTIVAVTNDQSIEETFNVYSKFERASGALLNRGKSKGMWAGSWKDRQDTPYGLQWVKQLPLLGATFSVGDYSTPTWEPALSNLESRLSAWAGRQLSFQGKIVIINSLALSQVWHLCHIFPMPGWAGKRILTAVWNFFWSGKRDLVARTMVSFPKGQGGFGVINLREKADSFALQWLKRFFAPSEGKWKAFFTHYYMSAFNMQPRNALLAEHCRQQVKQLPDFYQIVHWVWQTLDGDVLSLKASSDVSLELNQISSRNTYALLRTRNYKEPHCIQKYLLIYGQLHWSQTWSQLHICNLDRKVIDLNWQIAHGVLYTGARHAPH